MGKVVKMKACVRENTIKVEFAEKSTRPSDYEMLRFAVKLKILPEELVGFQQDLNDECMYYRLKDESEERVEEIVAQNAETTFVFGSGIERKVKVSPANKIIRYVRVFNLPFDIKDNCLIDVLKDYGEIVKIKWEKAESVFGYDAFNGIRGVHMELKNDLPGFIFVEDIKCKVFYQGLRDKCFQCGSVGHKKADCPKRFESHLNPRERASSNTPVIGNGVAMTSPLTFANVLSASENKQSKKLPDKNENAVTRMIPLNNELWSKIDKISVNNNDNIVLAPDSALIQNKNDLSAQQMDVQIRENEVVTDLEIEAYKKADRASTKGEAPAIEIFSDGETVATGEIENNDEMVENTEPGESLRNFIEVRNNRSRTMRTRSADRVKSDIKKRKDRKSVLPIEKIAQVSQSMNQ